MLTATGIKHDRQWMIVDSAGQFVTQREQPRLAFVTPGIISAGLLIEAPGMEPITFPFDADGPEFQVGLFGETLTAAAVDPAVDQWLSDYLGGSYRLAAFDPKTYRKGGVQYPARDDAPTSFPDNYGILVLSEESLSDLNGRLEQPLPMNRFRPNIVISGISEHDEDYFEALQVGDVRLRFINLCYRCNFTTIDQNTATFGIEPLQTLGKYRYDEAAKGVKFGAYAAVDQGIGRSLRVNDELDAVWKF